MREISAISGQHSDLSSTDSLFLNGFSIIPNFLNSKTLEQLRQKFFSAGYGERNLLLDPAVRDLAVSTKIKQTLVPILGPNCFAVRGIFFDKTEDANWKVPWHQDRVIGVKKKIEVDGFGLWSIKAGVNHVQPPAEVMSRMIAIRLHLDDCGEENGPLRVLPGSHEAGFLNSEQIESWKLKTSLTCCASKGDAILMRPLLLHTSSPCSVPGRRRVIHIEFAAGELPGGLEWNEKIQ